MANKELKAAKKRAKAAEKKAKAVEKRAEVAEKKAKAVEKRAEVAEKRAKAAEKRAEVAEKRAEAAESNIKREMIENGVLLQPNLRRRMIVKEMDKGSTSEDARESSKVIERIIRELVDEAFPKKCS